MTKISIEEIKEKAVFLNDLSNNEQALFDYINSSKSNVDEVLQLYQPQHEFRPVNTLRFLIANELRKGTVITKSLIEELKQTIEARDVSVYYELNDIVKQSLANYKDSRIGMFPNWRHAFKILFPFIYSVADNDQVNTALNQFADEIISANQLKDVQKHIVGFQGSQNYGTDFIWLAIIPESAPSVQYAYQIFFRIDSDGIIGGLYKGHNLKKQAVDSQELHFNSWEDYLEHTKQTNPQWLELNADINFIFMNDEKAFIKTLKKVDRASVSDYFNTLGRFKTDLDIQDEEKLVFSIAKNRLSFQVGKRYCLNLNKTHFDFISNADINDDTGQRETFSGTGSTYLYKERTHKDVLNNYDDIKSAIENEIERDNHALAKFYDNSAFRKAFFDSDYRAKVLGQLGIQMISKNEHMDNVKAEFITWLIKKPKSKYFNNDKETLNRYLDNYDTYFDINLFDVSKSNYKHIIETIDKVAYQNETSAFFKFSSGESSHRPRAILGKTNYYQFLEQRFTNKDEDIYTNDIYTPSLNQIFYGPPGTGKTYNTILEAAKIITRQDDLSYNEAQAVLNKNLGSQIEFITFHQNYSYEDFIQGLRPDVKQKELSFNRTDGVFTKMVTKALFEYYKVYQKSQKNPSHDTTTKIDLNDAFIEFMNSLEEGQEFETKTGSKIKVDNFTDRQNIEFKPMNGIKSYLVSGNRLLKLYDSFNDIKKIRRVHEDIVNVIGGCNATIYYVALREFIDFLEIYESTLIEFEDEEEGIDYENITYNRKKELLSTISLDDIRTVPEHKVPRYVIIIDEINRANISRVFGELITLIEKDKRSHGNIPLTATLPSGEQFIVPSNLFIIGTMNTADKSIALLDIALRRRFEFVPMYPNSESTEDKIVHDGDILEAINKEIISRKGYDFTIGHSYFMGDDYNLKHTIDNKVIPLLLEYFMNDDKEVKQILGAAQLVVEGWPMQYISND
ncbi:McrB family protein [Winogradskyella psychrotolerans]|uniref:McrB family protein n=1 Tax=Winogradskyella psychrotolerans TaxID=1344585 RepID=UPI001C074338|nr:AAA family ATPase [Winogradskyella psychrotolerans]MBU2929444.1 AAA family ATPase [Winogradskyella psychrotolerans]